MYNEKITNPIYKKLFPTTYEKNIKILEGLNYIQERFKGGPKKEVLDLLYKDSDNISELSNL